MSTGKTYERELVRELRKLTLTAERVPRSVADAMPGPIDDVICIPDGAPSADVEHRPITDYLQQIDDPGAFAEYVGDVMTIEVKYTSCGAHGIQTLLDAHLRGPGLGWPSPIYWRGAGVYTGGLSAFVAAVEQPAGAAETFELDDAPPQGTLDLLSDAEAGAIRASGEPWVLVWQGVE